MGGFIHLILTHGPWLEALALAIDGDRSLVHRINQSCTPFVSSVSCPDVSSTGRTTD